MKTNTTLKNLLVSVALLATTLLHPVGASAASQDGPHGQVTALVPSVSACRVSLEGNAQARDVYQVVRDGSVIGEGMLLPVSDVGLVLVPTSGETPRVGDQVVYERHACAPPTLPSPPPPAPQVTVSTASVTQTQPVVADVPAAPPYWMTTPAGSNPYLWSCANSWNTCGGWYPGWYRPGVNPGVTWTATPSLHNVWTPVPSAWTHGVHIR